MPYKFSPSSLSLLDDCPRCFWLQFNKGIKRPSGIFPSLPSGMDKILKEHFDSFRDKGELPPELKHLAGEIKLFENAELLKDWRNNFKGITFLHKKTNLLISGAIDDLWQSSKGEYIIVEGGIEAIPLIKEIYRLIIKRGAFPKVNLGFPGQSYIYYKNIQNTS